MRVSKPVRRAGLSLHVLSSVGWVGAVAVYLALSIAAVTTDDAALQSAVYLVMDWAAWVVLVPFAIATFVTGVTQSLLSPWGLFRHYWVIVKLVLTVVATVVLVAYTQTLDVFADVAAHATLTAQDRNLLSNPTVVVHSTGALVLLVVATVLAVYKPAGLTRHGQRQRTPAPTS